MQAPALHVSVDPYGRIFAHPHCGDTGIEPGEAFTDCEVEEIVDTAIALIGFLQGCGVHADQMIVFDTDARVQVLGDE